MIGLPIVIVTGLLSNDAYQPGLGANALGRNIGGPLDLYLFGWPTRPSWLYALTQGLHVAVGLALVPVLLAKLWSVIPRLFEWPPVRSPAHALERLSLALLVGGALFEFVTGILNIQYWYAFQFFFTQAHYYGAWVFIGAFIAHVTLKFGTMRRSLTTPRGSPRSRSTGAAASAESGAGARSLTAASPLADDDVAPRAAGNGRGGLGAAAGLQGAAQSRRRPVPRAGVPPSPRTHPPRPTRLPDQQDGAGRRHLSARPSAQTGGFSWPASERSPYHASSCWRCPSTPTICRSRASRDGRRHSAGAACGCATSPSLCGVEGPATVTTQSLERGTSATRRSVTSRWPTIDRCWRCASTASTSRSITATRRG